MVVVLMSLAALAGTPEPDPRVQIGESLAVDEGWEPTAPAAPSPPWADKMVFDQSRSMVLLHWNTAEGDGDDLVLPYSWIDHLEVRTGSDDVPAEMAMVGKDGSRLLAAHGPDVHTAKGLVPSLTGAAVVELPPTAPWPTFTRSRSGTSPQLGMGSVAKSHRRVRGTHRETTPSTVAVGDVAAPPPPYADDAFAAALVAQRHGTVDSAALAQALADSSKPLTACYTSALKRQADLQGQVSVRFVLGGDGHVLAAAADDGDVGDATLRKCLVSRISAMKLPQPADGVVVVDCPLVLTPQ